ncbi:DapH/DapD/GlmU-related protein [Actomonas aquatica]|uniref:DapH/DapD/GlmU-related protein n=1 Tax=Actomonas aquatica TaxID=2866162 RepID=A0ABZ1C5U7_9BACT|nr:DapH/DapD/GlmU-related protein [Opitutus sp. WL0086]WRQ86618.1 DapH/DapD/GlmU-related protein [Opitutus sp. WL0086]
MSTSTHSSPDIFARLRAGETVPFDDPECPRLREAAMVTRPLVLRLNQTADPDEMRALMSEITGQELDPSFGIFPPFHTNYGRQTKLGKNVFINFDCVFLDLGGITLEDGVFLAPKVSLLTESHPLKPAERHALKAAPIHIKRNVWVGAGATILGGVTIGENAVVAAGAVVSKDVPANTVVGGIPAKHLKTIE